MTQVAAGIGRELSYEEAMAFLNQQGDAYDMWKQMMRAGEDYIKHTLRGGRTLPISHPGHPANAWHLRRVGVTEMEPFQMVRGRRRRLPYTAQTRSHR